MNLFRRALAGGVTAAALLALALALASGCAAEPAEETQEIAAVVREIDAPPLAPTEEEIGARRALERRVRAAAERLDRATTATRRETLDDLAALGPAAAPAVRALLAPRHPLEAEALLARWKESGAGASGPAGPAAARAVRCDLRSDAPVLPLAGKATLRLSIENGGGAPLNVDFSGGAGSDPARARLVVTYVLRDEFGAVAEVQETLRVGLSGRYLLAPGRAVEAAIPFRLSDDVRLRAVVVEAVVRAEARAAHGFEGAAPSFAAFTAGPVSVRFADAPFDDLRRDLPATLRLITDPRQLLSAAAATPAERRADAADALVAALERGPSPLTRAACAALAMLAGAEAGRSPDEWRDWWADNRETWRARDLRLRGEEEPGPTLPTGAK